MEGPSRLTYEGFQAWIEIDKKELQCYLTDVDHAKKTVTCWITSEAGKTFLIGCQPAQSKIPSRACAYLDGTRVKSSYFWEKSKKTKSLCRYFDTIRTSGTMHVPFMFSTLELTDDDNYLEASSMANVGEIKLIFQSIADLVWKKRHDPEKSARSADWILPTVEKVHERSKKAITHRISFGDEQLGQPRNPSRPHYTPKERLVTFIFRYRPLDVLQANGIVPRIPDLVPSQDNENDRSTSSQSSGRKRKATCLKEEVQESVKDFEDRESALLAELSRLKDEKEKFLLAELEKLRKDKRSTNDNAPRKKVKTETKPLFLSGEVIDLT